MKDNGPLGGDIEARINALTEELAKLKQEVTKQEVVVEHHALVDRQVQDAVDRMNMERVRKDKVMDRLAAHIFQKVKQTLQKFNMDQNESKQDVLYKEIENTLKAPYNLSRIEEVILPATEHIKNDAYGEVIDKYNIDVIVDINYTKLAGKDGIKLNIKFIVRNGKISSIPYGGNMHELITSYGINLFKSDFKSKFIRYEIPYQTY